MSELPKAWFAAGQSEKLRYEGSAKMRLCKLVDPLRGLTRPTLPARRAPPGNQRGLFVS